MVYQTLAASRAVGESKSISSAEVGVFHVPAPAILFEFGDFGLSPGARGGWTSGSVFGRGNPAYSSAMAVC